MLKKILPTNIYEILNNKVGFEKINEIRLRAARPVTILCEGQVYFLTNNGLAGVKDLAINLTKEEVEEVVYKASEFSIYSVNEEIKQGFIILPNGERLGICGSVISDNGEIKTITNFTSLNLRIPHEIKGACLNAFTYMFEKDNKEICNTLIISPPAKGKTTFLRDFIYQMSKKNIKQNVLVIDERGEIAGKNNVLNLGYFVDVLAFCDKRTGFLQGIRAMAPDVIITDELGDESDFNAINYASSCGVKIVASIHGRGINELKRKVFFPSIEKVFSRYVVLSNKVLGKIEAVYNENFLKIYNGD